MNMTSTHHPFQWILRHKKWSFPAISILGIIITLTYLSSASPLPPVAQPIIQPMSVPFTYYIGGAGMTEANTDNIAVGTHIPGIVKKIFVEIGQNVQEGDPLFLIEDQQAIAAKEQAQAQYAQAQTKFRNAQDRLSRLQRVTDKRAVSEEELQERTAEFDGSKAEQDAAEAYLKTLQTTLDLHTVRAAISGNVLTLDIRVGEYAPTGTLSTPLMRIGNVHPLHIRVDIDENDAWRLIPKANAIAYVRGNPSLHFPLSFVRIEPYIRPKQSLTGNSLERVDTRVLQVIYAFEPEDKPVYSGQQMDVFIEAPPHQTPSTPTVQ